MKMKKLLITYLGLNDMKNLITILLLLTSLVGFSQISGTVIDETGGILPFVNIKSIEHNIGTTTDFDGKFNIDVPVGSKLVFSFISFRTDTLESTPNMNVTLYDRTLELGMVTVTTDKIVGSEVGLVNEKKESDEVESSIGKKELTPYNVYLLYFLVLNKFNYINIIYICYFQKLKVPIIRF